MSSRSSQTNPGPVAVGDEGELLGQQQRRRLVSVALSLLVVTRPVSLPDICCLLARFPTQQHRPGKDEIQFDVLQVPVTILELHLTDFGYLIVVV